MDLFNQNPTIGPDKSGIPRSLQEQLIEKYGSLDNVPQTNFQQPSLSSLGANAPKILSLQERAQSGLTINPLGNSNKDLTGPYAGVLEDFRNSEYFRGVHSMTGFGGLGGVQEFNPFGSERGLFGDGDQEAGFLQFLDETMAGGFGGSIGGDMRRSEYGKAYNAFNPFEGEGRKFDNIYEQREGQNRYSKVLTPEQKAEVARFEAMSPDERSAVAQRTVGDPSMNSSQGIETQGTDTTDIFDRSYGAGTPNFGPRTVNGENISLDDFIGKSEITNFLPDAFSPSTPDFKIKDPTTPLPGGGTPFNNPIAPMPSPITPPPNMNSSHSHDDLLKGIGDLFKQYFPNQGSNFNQSTTQPMFDAVGNSAPAQQTTPQVFGNMITPFGRQS